MPLSILKVSASSVVLLFSAVLHPFLGHWQCLLLVSFFCPQYPHLVCGAPLIDDLLLVRRRSVIAHCLQCCSCILRVRMALLEMNRVVVPL